MFFKIYIVKSIIRPEVVNQNICIGYLTVLI